MNQSIPFLWVFLTLLLAWALYKVYDFYQVNKHYEASREYESKAYEEPPLKPVEWIIQLLISLGHTWYILLGLFALGFLMLKTMVGVNVMDYVDATLRDGKTGSYFSDWLIALLKYAFTLLALLVLALSNWLTPQNNETDLPRQVRSIRFNVYRYESAIVFVLMTLFIDRVYFIDNPEPLRFTAWSLVLNVAFILLISFSINVYMRRYDGRSPRRHRQIAGLPAAATAIAVVFILAIDSSEKWYTELVRRSIQVNVLLTGLWFWIMTYPPEKPVMIARKMEQMCQSVDLELNNLFRWILLAVLYLVAALYLFVPNVMPFPPLATLLLGIAFIIFNLDVLHFCYTGESFAGLKGKPAQLAVLFVSGLLVWLMFIQVKPAYLALVPGEKTVDARPDFDQAFMAWLNDRAADIQSDSVYPVYIVTGQGGGSRAGFWISQVLLGLDTCPALNFREHCFALSTVSGSSAGAAATLAFWHKLAQQPPETPKVQRLSFPQEVFQGNFVTNGIAGLFFSGPAHKVIPFGAYLFPDRNQRLQAEEAFSVSRAMYAVEGKSWNFWKDMFCTTRCFDEPNALTAHFLTLYAQRDPEPEKQLPYFFPNTCHVQTGKRAVVSPLQPVKNQRDSIFVQAIDFLRNGSDSLRGPTLGAVANVSELFPGFSMAASTHNGDSYVDGGYYENYGKTTGLDLYRRCLKVLEDTTNGLPSALRAPRVRLVLIAVNNDVEELTPTQYKPSNQWLAPVSAVFNTRFGGQSEYMRAIAKLELESNYIEICNASATQVPLTRVLTKRNMVNMNALAGQEIHRVDSLIRSWTGQ